MSTPRTLAFLAAALWCAFAIVSAEFTLELKRDAGSSAPNPSNDKALLDGIVAKYLRNAESYYKNTGKHARFVNSTKLKKRGWLGTASLGMLEQNWNVQLEFGSDKQKLYVKFDTGSPDVVMDGRGYDPSSSSTAKDLDTPFEAGYGSAHAAGKVYTDTIAMGGIEAKDVWISVSDDPFLTMNRDAGLIGLSWPVLSSLYSRETTFYEAFKQQKRLRRNVYQFTLKSHATSHLDVGHVNRLRFLGILGWVSVNPDDGYWKTDVNINGNDYTGIIDTGTTLIVASNEKMKSLLSKLDGVTLKQDDEGNYQGWYDCKKPPKISFHVGGKRFTMPRNTMKYWQNGNECRLPFTGLDGFSDWIFGTPFLEMASVVFDFDNARLGFASQSWLP